MVDDRWARQGPPDGFVEFHASGTRARGPFRCADCGYGVSVEGRLPACPMCGGASWEPELRPSFGRAGEVVERL